jgi:transmembrane sensor
MSENPGIDSVLPPSDEIDARAVAWFTNRNDAHEWSDAAQAELDAWLAQSPKHLLAYWRVEAAWNRAGLLAAVRPARGERTNGNERRPWSLWLGRVASVAAVLAIGVMMTFYLTGGRPVTYATPIGGHRQLALADGSRIELNTDTIVQVSSAGQGRQVELVQGEAFFHVKHDAAHPFIVKAGNHRLVDLGTDFFVRKDAMRMRVGLVEGRVRLESATGARHPQSAVLAPGDVALATADKFSVTKNAVRALSDDLGWRNGNLVFHRATLAEAVSEFNRYNERKLVIADAQVARLTFSSVFPTNGIDAFTRVAQKAMGLRVERRGEEIVISR